ncbi:peptidase [Flavivirga aquatica]|uniref:Peptidase n=1 Tax=Flavivirga aquatica TaxID=1849968 RepID=A0A1E5TBK5_9FLAO|nr:M57 family metalloprotease [Flavivirga aquatica]OEK08773.1 peptidase [Flavivirga aquatica]
MKNFKVILIAILSLTFIFQSCQKDDVVIDETNELKSESGTDTGKVTKAMLKKLSSFYMNTDNVRTVDFLLPDGTTKPMIQVEGDIMLSEEQVMKMDMGNGLTDRNYRTNNLVSQGRNISIIGFTGDSGQGLSEKERTGLQWAVNNFNRLNGVSISFTLTFGTDYEDKDMVVYHNPNEDEAGGSAGFPSNGLPNKFVQIYGLNNYNTNVIEHVITHEIGHSVGFRHTDWQTRQSCRNGRGEQVGSVGANEIPGTSAGYNPNSIMVACFSNNEDGEFDSDDIIGLQNMY